MSRYRFERHPEDDSSYFETSMEFEATTLDDMFEHFKMFLQGCGFSIDGEIVVDKTEEPE